MPDQAQIAKLSTVPGYQGYAEYLAKGGVGPVTTQKTGLQALQQIVSQQQAAEEGADLSNYVKLSTGEYVSKEQYAALTAEQQQKLQALGIEGFTSWNTAQIAANYVQLSTGEYVPKEGFGALSAEDQALLMKLGVTQFNEQKETEFAATYIKVKDDYVTKEEYNKLSAADQSKINELGVTGFNDYKQAQYDSLIQQVSSYKTEDGYDVLSALQSGKVPTATLVSLFGQESVDSAQATVNNLKLMESYKTADGYNIVAAVQGNISSNVLVSLFGQEALDSAKSMVASLSVMEPYKTDNGYNIVDAINGGVSPSTLVDLFGEVAVSDAQSMAAFVKDLEPYKTVVNGQTNYNLIGALDSSLYDKYGQNMFISVFGNQVVNMKSAMVTLVEFRNEDGTYNLIKIIEDPRFDQLQYAAWGLYGAPVVNDTVAALYKYKDFVSANVQLSTGEWVSKPTWDSLPVEQQDFLYKFGVYQYNKTWTDPYGIGGLSGIIPGAEYEQAMKMVNDMAFAAATGGVVEPTSPATFSVVNVSIPTEISGWVQKPRSWSEVSTTLDTYRDTAGKIDFIKAVSEGAINLTEAQMAGFNVVNSLINKELSFDQATQLGWAIDQKTRDYVTTMQKLGGQTIEAAISSNTITNQDMVTMGVVATVGQAEAIRNNLIIAGKLSQYPDLMSAAAAGALTVDDILALNVQDASGHVLTRVEAEEFLKQAPIQAKLAQHLTLDAAVVAGAVTADDLVRIGVTDSEGNKLTKEKAQEYIDYIVGVTQAVEDIEVLLAKRKWGGNQYSITEAINEVAPNIKPTITSYKTGKDIIVNKWEQLTIDQKKAVASVYLGDAFKGNWFAETTKVLAIGAQRGGIFGELVFTPVLGITLPISKQITGQNVTPMEWVGAGVTAAMDVLLVGGATGLIPAQITPGMSTIGKLVTISGKAATAGVVSFGGYQYVNSFPKMTNAERLVFGGLLLAGAASLAPWGKIGNVIRNIGGKGQIIEAPFSGEVVVNINMKRLGVIDLSREQLPAAMGNAQRYLSTAKRPLRFLDDIAELTSGEKDLVPMKGGELVKWRKGPRQEFWRPEGEGEPTSKIAGEWTPEFDAEIGYWDVILPKNKSSYLRLKAGEGYYLGEGVETALLESGAMGETVRIYDVPRSGSLSADFAETPESQAWHYLSRIRDIRDLSQAERTAVVAGVAEFWHHLAGIDIRKLTKTELANAAAEVNFWKALSQVKDIRELTKSEQEASPAVNAAWNYLAKIKDIRGLSEVERTALAPELAAAWHYLAKVKDIRLLSEYDRVQVNEALEKMWHYLSKIKDIRDEPKPEGIFPVTPQPPIKPQSPVTDYGSGGGSGPAKYTTKREAIYAIDEKTGKTVLVGEKVTRVRVTERPTEVATKQKQYQKLWEDIVKATKSKEVAKQQKQKALTKEELAALEELRKKRLAKLQKMWKDIAEAEKKVRGSPRTSPVARESQQLTQRTLDAIARSTVHLEPINKPVVDAIQRIAVNPGSYVWSLSRILRGQGEMSPAQVNQVIQQLQYVLEQNPLTTDYPEPTEYPQPQPQPQPYPSPTPYPVPYSTPRPEPQPQPQPLPQPSPYPKLTTETPPGKGPPSIKPPIPPFPKGRERNGRVPRGTITWKQGKILQGKELKPRWWVWEPPYMPDTQYLYSQSFKPKGAKELDGPRSAYRTIQTLKSRSVPQLLETSRLGIMNVSIERGEMGKWKKKPDAPKRGPTHKHKRTNWINPGIGISG